jgi:hypothetical protein
MSPSRRGPSGAGPVQDPMLSCLLRSSLSAGRTQGRVREAPVTTHAEKVTAGTSSHTCCTPGAPIARPRRTASRAQPPSHTPSSRASRSPWTGQRHLLTDLQPAPTVMIFGQLTADGAYCEPATVIVSLDWGIVTRCAIRPCSVCLRCPPYRLACWTRTLVTAILTKFASGASSTDPRSTSPTSSRALPCGAMTKICTASTPRTVSPTT